jgi:hypothetical protein
MIKQALSMAGAYTPESLICRLDACLNYLEVGRWLRTQGFKIPRRVAHRTELFELVAQEVGDRQVLYLEFGVYRGASLREWSRLLAHPGSVLHGFDSFEGLPESWRQHAGKGCFSTRGQLPQIEDPRVRFFPGWFEQVLPSYQPPPHDVLILNLDADLYSSTLCVLRSLRRWIQPGTYLYFDEFSDRANELKAFSEFLDESGLRFRLRGGHRTLTHVLFQCTA